jgi:hypothetical protein
MKYIGGVVSTAAKVADSDDHVFENHKTGLMFERLALDLLGSDSSFAVLTFVAEHNLFLRLGHRIDRDYEVAAGTCKRPTPPTAVCSSAAAPLSDLKNLGISS